MGKNGWLIAVKRAFRSPTKDSDKKTHTKTHHTDLDQQDDNKKREKKRWRLFRKPTAATEVAHAPMMSNLEAPTLSETRHAVAEVGQPPPTCSREYYAAIVIQTAFRGYLARRALRALKALVKLQALVRGNNVRKHAKMTLQCMQALVRVQARVLEQRMKQCDQSSRKSTLSDANNHWGHRYQHDISERRSMLRDGSSIADDWDEQPHTIEEVKAMLQSRIARQEKTLSPPFSQETRRNGRNPSTGNDGELGLGDRHQWLDRWMGSKPWETRASIDQRDIGVKTVEVDTSQPYSYLPPTNHLRRSSYPQRAPATPSPSKTRPMQVRSASPHYIRERSHHSNQSQRPSLKSNFSFNSVVHQHPRGSPMPNYMAATESAKARVRSQNVPRRIPWTPERDRSGLARKRLSFPVSDAHSGNAYKQQSLRSPSFLSINGVSNYSESIAGGEVSPCSTTDLRRWVQ